MLFNFNLYMVCKYDGFELVEERWISYSVAQGMFLVTDALKRVAKVVEGRGGEVLIPFHAQTEKFTCIAV